MKTTELFVKEIASRIKGDDDQAQASKIARQANTAIEGQLAALNSEMLDATDLVEKCTELFQETVYPKNGIPDRKAYAANIITTYNALENAKAELDSVKDSHKLFTNILNGKLAVLRSE